MPSAFPGAHESKERTRAPLATNLISHAHAVDDSQEWCFFLPPGSAAPTGAAAQDTQWGMQVGPTNDFISTDRLHVWRRADGATRMELTTCSAETMHRSKNAIADADTRHIWSADCDSLSPAVFLHLCAPSYRANLMMISLRWRRRWCFSLTCVSRRIVFVEQCVVRPD